jgi:hypothetical protein
VVNIVTPSERQKMKVIDGMKVRVEIDKNGEQKSVSVDAGESQAWAQNVIKEHIESIKCYEVGGKAILNGSDLWEYGEQDLINELILEILQSLSFADELKKNSGVPLNSTPAGINHSLGTATSA